jgi:tetratricopeptide (TPR) repeat protein
MAIPAPNRSKIVTTLVVIAAAVSLYYLGAWLVTVQIGNSHTNGDCTAAVKWSGSVNWLFPRLLVPFTARSVAQAEECGLYLDAIQFQDKSDWEPAYAGYQTYVARYPSGSFIPQVMERSAQTLLAWARMQGESGQHSESVESLLTLLNNYPDAAVGGEAEALLPQAYLAHGQVLRGQNEFQRALEALELAASADPNPSDPQGPAARALGLEAGYRTAWGDTLIADGQFAEGLQQYERALELASAQEAQAIQAAIFDATLKWTAALASTGSYDDALTQIDRLRESAEGEADQDRINAAQAAVYLAFSQSDGELAAEAMSAQAETICLEGRVDPNAPPILALNADGQGVFALREAGTARVLRTIETSYSPRTPGEMRFVACATTITRTAQTCSYSGGLSLIGRRTYWKIQLYDAVSGEVKRTAEIAGPQPDVGSFRLSSGGTGMKLGFLVGGDPGTCPSSLRSWRYNTHEVRGPSPTSADMETWLKTILE